MVSFTTIYETDVISVRYEYNQVTDICFMLMSDTIDCHEINNPKDFELRVPTICVCIFQCVSGILNEP